MLKRLKSFLLHEDGAVTVDWVVLCALIVGFTLASYASMETTFSEFATNVATYIASLSS
ncbi:Flp family type IVb pilin [Phaeobacter sp. HF9A]|uniref:Flp family type IVb pilin n=1 Tax=Phaeobacter sp. HF9A TaxID=2721561 RepID=UPI0014302316|nr:hypothetical protein [Phaeobacter sp. HF9A]NIZ13374.1 hypothetical protein [Phaeobacter sp. HF9A]